MIHLFRKIRHQLLSENRIKKYLLYALGEIVLVMIGILLALQFNNLNQAKENNKKEEWYLINVAEDIEYQKGDLKDLILNYKNTIKVSKQILKDYKKNNSFIEVDSLNDKLNDISFTDNFPNINNTYQELVSSGQLSLIKDKDLSLDLIDFYLYCEDNAIDVKNNNDNIYFKEIYPILNKLSQTNLSNDELDYDDTANQYNSNDLDDFLKRELKKPNNKLALLNAIKTQTMIQVFHLEMAEETLKVGKDLVAKIDAYLGLTYEDVNHYD